MSPLDFIKDASDGNYNSYAGPIFEALSAPIKIVSKNKEWEVLSYFYDSVQGRFILEIEEDANELACS